MGGVILIGVLLDQQLALYRRRQAIRPSPEQSSA
jgi:hypothetical protein